LAPLAEGQVAGGAQDYVNAGNGFSSINRVASIGPTHASHRGLGIRGGLHGIMRACHPDHPIPCATRPR
jgi:hypothetical protein